MGGANIVCDIEKKNWEQKIGGRRTTTESEMTLAVSQYCRQ